MTSVFGTHFDTIGTFNRDVLYNTIDFVNIFGNVNMIRNSLHNGQIYNPEYNLVDMFLVIN